MASLRPSGRVGVLLASQAQPFMQLLSVKMCLAVPKAHPALLASHKALEDEPRGITLDAQRFPQWIGWENLRIHHTPSSLAAGAGSTSHRQ